MEYLRAFITGGIICVIAQVLIDKTKITPSKILVVYVTSGVILGAIGIYKPIVDFGGAGAKIPLLGFGYNLADGVMKEVDKAGLLGAFTGGVKASAGGITAAVVFGYITAVIFNPKMKR